MRKVAVFDIDGTLFRSSLLIELVDALIQEGIFSPDVGKLYEKSYKDWLNRKDSYENYIWAVIMAFNSNIKGVPYGQFLEVAQKVVAFHKSRVYRYTRDLIQDLKKKNYFLLAISQSPKTVLDPFCEEFGFDKVYGRLYETDDKEIFTGNAMYDTLMQDKAKVLQRAVSKEGLTLKDSYGVGDTESDIPLLKLVEHPVCFNPNQKLYTYAKHAGWPIVVERKDVVYRL